jgi:signal transduction histidine kinase
LFNDFQVDDVFHHGGGDGVGLALLKHIVEIHNGTVTVFNNNNDEFSCFKIMLPLLQ